MELTVRNELDVQDDWEEIDELMAREAIEASDRELAEERWVVSE